MDKQTYRKVGKTDNHKDRQIYRKMNKRMDTETYRYTDGRKYELKDGHIDVQKGREMEE